MVIKWLILVITISGLLIGKSKYKNWINPYSIFNLLWLVVDILLIIGNTNVYEPSKVAYSCVFIGILAYNLSVFTPKLVIGNHRGYQGAYYLSDRAILFVAIITLVLSVIMAGDSIRNILNGVSISDARILYFTYDTSSSLLMYYVRNYMALPLGYVVIALTVLELFGEDGNKRKYLLWVSIAIIALQAIASGGRYILMNSLFAFICGFYFYKKQNKFSSRQKMILFLLVAVAAYGIVYLTDSRSTMLMQNMTMGEKLYTTIYQYFAGSVTYLGKVIENTPEVVGSTMGINFAAGFISPFFVVLNYLHILPYPRIFNVIGTNACVQLLIGPHTYYNAMPTIFGYFYIDGGLILTFIEAWFFGYIAKRVYENATENRLLYVAFYVLLFIQICNSSTRWFMYTPDFSLAFVYMCLVIRKRHYIQE